MGLSQLEYLYDFELKKISYIDRKFKIDENKIIIKAPRQSGITTLIFAYLSNYKKGKYLYIDFNDIRISKHQIMKNLDSFIEKNNISIVVLENFDFSYFPPLCEKVIITTEYNHKIKDFANKRFFPLDFEEYIAFEKRYLTIEQIFNSYTNTGTFPKIALSPQVEKIKNLQILISDVLKDSIKIEIYKYINNYQGEKTSIYQIFQTIKKTMKISKDSFYKYFQDFETKNFILMLEKYNQPNTHKKLYLLDFAIKNALSFKKDFLKKFENMIFLELYKKKDKFYYTDEIDFFLPSEKLGILCIPFLPSNLLKSKIIKRKKHFLKLNIKKIEIISIGNEYSFKDENIDYEIIPFWNWANSLS